MASRFIVHRYKDRGGLHFVIYDSRFSRYVNLVWNGDEGRDKAHAEAKRLELMSASSKPVGVLV